MANVKTNSKLQNRHKSGIKSETIELLRSFAKAKFQKIAEEEEEKKRYLGAENLLAFGEMAVCKPVEQPESDNSDDSNLKISLQQLNQNESASYSSPSRSASESPSSFILLDVIQLLANKKQLHSQTAKFHEPETAKTISNVPTHLKLSLAWKKLQKEHPAFKNANGLTESEKDLILRLIYRINDKPFKPDPKSSGRKIIKFKDYYDTIYTNNMIQNRHRLFYFLGNTYTCKWDIKVVNKRLNFRYV